MNTLTTSALKAVLQKEGSESSPSGKPPEKSETVDTTAPLAGKEAKEEAKEATAEAGQDKTKPAAAPSEGGDSRPAKEAEKKE